MDQVEHVKKLREEYERALDAAESRRSAYHEAVLELYQGGTPLREIAKELGLSHQRVHQIVSGEPPRRSKLPRAAGGAAGIALILAAATLGALRLAHAPPFAERVPSRVSVPDVVNEPASVARQHLTEAGLHVRVFYRHAPIGSDRVIFQKETAGKRVARGSLVVLFVAGPHPSGPELRSGLALVAARHVPGFRPGGAAFRRKHEVLVRTTPLGQVSLWRAPDRVSPSARCSWLQIGRMGAGGSCYQPSRHGLPQVVPLRFSLRKHGRTVWVPLIWGRVGAGVARLTIKFRDGARATFPAHDGMFLYAVPISQSRWARGHVPAFVVARAADGRVVDRRPFPPGTAFRTPFAGPTGPAS